MKLKNLKDEVNFVRTASPQELHAYLKTTRFSRVATEKELVKRCASGDKNLSDITTKYIKKYGLRQSARIEVFRSQAYGLIKLLLATSSGEEHTTALKEFSKHGNYHFVWLYIKESQEEDIAKVFPESLLIATHDIGELSALIKSKKLSPFAQLEIIVKNIHFTLIEALIKSGLLQEREKMAIMTTSSWETVNLLIEREKNPAEKQALNEMKLIRFSHSSKIGRFIANNRFCGKAEHFFYKHGEFSQIVRYIKHYNTIGGHEAVINRASPEEILNFLSKNWLCENGEKLILNRGKHREIKAYIKKHYFSEDNETRFIKRGRHNEIMLYIANHSLCDTAQCELIYRRNSSEIEYYVTHYPLADIAETALLKCATPETIRLWQKNIPDYSKVKK